jgi:sugar phosphate permease
MLNNLKKIKHTVFFGWWIVLACNIMTFWGNSFYVYGFGVFFKPLSSEFGWSRAATAGAISLGKIEGGLKGIFGGILTDKYGPRLISFIGSLIAGAGLILMSRIDSLFSFSVFWSISSLGINLGLAGPLYKSITDWFVKKRGLALSFSKAGFALGGSVLPFIITTFYSGMDGVRLSLLQDY